MWKTFSGFLESRKLVSKVNTFPTATQEEIHKANDKCIFCLETLTEAKKINCGHLFHYKCLRSYFENSINPKCPTCRANIDEKTVNHRKNQHFMQNVASSFLLQELPSNVNFLGKPVDIGATAWGLPRSVKSHKIVKDSENMKHAFESMNEFVLRFYMHPPEDYEGAEIQRDDDRFADFRDMLRDLGK
jgi:phosphomevalonate kinase